MLAEAVCKLEGFVYAPSDSVYWQHGHSTERDFIYVTTANLSHAQLQQLSDEVGSTRSLLVVCSALRGRKDGYGNLTVKKIPKCFGATTRRRTSMLCTPSMRRSSTCEIFASFVDLCRVGQWR